MSPEELRKKMEKLRNGEEVLCTECGSGKIEPSNNTDCKTTHGFICDNCGMKINVD